MSTSTKKAAKPGSTAKKTTTKRKSTPRSKAKASSATATPKKVKTPEKPSPTTAIDGSAPEARTATPSIVTGPRPVVAGPVLRKKELIDRVVARAGIKKRDAKPVIEAMLAELGEALGEDRELVLHPMGRLRVHKKKDMPKKQVMILKVHQQKKKKDEPGTSDLSKGPEH